MAADNFDVFITGDLNLQFQQNGDRRVGGKEYATQ